MLHYFREHAEVSMVADQIGSPTWAKNLAIAIWAATNKPEIKGIYHWADAGVASKYDLALAILEEALELKLLMQNVNIKPIKSAEFKTPAKRPLFSVLDSSLSWQDLELHPLHWRQALRQMLQELVT